MSRANALSALPHGREAVDQLRGKVVQLGEAALPRVAAATESGGEALSQFARSSSRQIARTIRAHQSGRSSRLAGLLPMTPLLRGGLRFAARNPAIIAAAGLGIAALGFAAWRRQHARSAAEPAAPSSGREEDRDDYQPENQNEMREL